MVDDSVKFNLKVYSMQCFADIYTYTHPLSKTISSIATAPVGVPGMAWNMSMNGLSELMLATLCCQ